MQKIILTLCALLVTSPLAYAQCDQCVECVECQTAMAVGFLKKQDKKVTTFKVEQKEIAVPKICMPKPLFNFKKQICSLLGKKCVPGSPCGACEIDDCPKHVRNGCIKTVNVLKKSSVKCKACGYEWEVTDSEKVNEYLYGPFEKVEEKAASEKQEAKVEVVDPLMNDTPPKAPVMGQPLIDPGPQLQPEQFSPPPTPPKAVELSGSNAFLIRAPVMHK